MIRQTQFDDRGVSEIIGAILVFGLVVLSMVLFQTNAVPSANEKVEFDHSQQVQADLLGLDAELSDAAASGAGGTAVVTVGTDYPSRFLFRNPPAVSGSLTTEDAAFSIENAVAVGNGETDDYWDGTTDRSFDSRELVYRVDYNVYEEAPTTFVSHGVVYSRYPGGKTRRIDAGGFIDGRSIELSAVIGQRSESRVGPVSVPVTPQSAPTETVRVSGDGGPIVLRIATEATAAEWEEFLEDELAVNGGHVTDVRDGAGDTVEVVLEGDTTYDLELARVSVGSAPYTPKPAYVTTNDDTGRSVTVGEPTDLTVQVRDQYNRPVADKKVNFITTYPTLPTEKETVTTDDEGRATLEFMAAQSGDVTVTADVESANIGPGDPLSVVYELTASTGDDDTQGSDGELNPGGDDALVLTSAILRNCSPPDENQRIIAQTDPDGNCQVETTFQNRGRDRTITAVRVNVYSASQAYVTGNPGQPDPRKRPNEWSFETENDQDFAEESLTLSSPKSLSAGTQYQYRFQFELSNDRFNAAEGDFYVLTFRFSDGSTSSYVVAPQD